MKAKHITKIRAESQYYEVAETEALFGGPYSSYKAVVLARNYREAAERYKKRIGKSDWRSWYSETEYRWGYYKVHRYGKPEHHRFIKYYGI